MVFGFTGLGIGSPPFRVSGGVQGRVVPRKLGSALVIFVLAFQMPGLG